MKKSDFDKKNEVIKKELRKVMTGIINKGIKKKLKTQNSETLSGYNFSMMSGQQPKKQVQNSNSSQTEEEEKIDLDQGYDT